MIFSFFTVLNTIYTEYWLRILILLIIIIIYSSCSGKTRVVPQRYSHAFSNNSHIPKNKSLRNLTNLIGMSSRFLHRLSRKTAQAAIPLNNPANALVIPLETTQQLAIQRAELIIVRTKMIMRFVSSNFALTITKKSKIKLSNIIKINKIIDELHFL